MHSKLGPRARRSRRFPLPRLRVRSKIHTQRQSLARRRAPLRSAPRGSDRLVHSDIHPPIRTRHGPPPQALSRGSFRRRVRRLPRLLSLATRAVLAPRAAPRREFSPIPIRRSPSPPRASRPPPAPARARARAVGVPRRRGIRPTASAASIATTRGDATRARTRERERRTRWKSFARTRGRTRAMEASMRARVPRKSDRAVEWCRRSVAGSWSRSE